MSRLRDGDIRKIVDAYTDYDDIEKYARVVPIEEIKENDYNLSVTRYVDIFDEEESIDIPQVLDELKELEDKRKNIEDNLNEYLTELGYE